MSALRASARAVTLAWTLGLILAQAPASAPAAAAPGASDEGDPVEAVELLGVPPPRCWEAADQPGFGLGVGGAGRATGARRYGDVRVASPRFHELGDALWLGDVDRLARYEFADDNFTTVWESDGGQGLFAFANGTFYWSANQRPSPDGEVVISAVPMEGGTVRSMTLNVRSIVEDYGWDIRTEGHRWFSPMALLGRDGAPGHLYLIVEFTRARELSTAVVQLQRDGDALRVVSAWSLPELFDRYALLPGEPDVLLLIDNSTYLSALALQGAEAELSSLDVEDVSALAVGDGGLLIGLDTGCVILKSVSVQGARVAHAEEDSWCPGDDPWGLPGSPVRSLASLSGGRVLVSLGDARRLRGEGEDSEASLRSFVLAPAANTAGSRVLPLPVAEAVERDGREAVEISGVLEDASGRIWASVRDEQGQLGQVRRLDLPFTPTATALGGEVLQQLPLGDGAVALVRSADGRSAAWRFEPAMGVGWPVSLPDDVDLIRLVADAGGAWALGRDAEGGGLWWISADGAAERSLRLSSLPADARGVRLTAEAVLVEIGALDGEASQQRFDRETGAALGGREERRCDAPSRLPSRVGDRPVCADPAGGARWGSDADAERLIPMGEAGWLAWSRRPGELALGAPGEEPTLRFVVPEALDVDARPIGLYPDPRGRPWLYLATKAGVERLREDGELALVASRDDVRVQRDLPRGCEARHTGLSDDIVGWFVDGRQVAWVSLADAKTGRPQHLVGPVMPSVPRFTVGPFPWEPLRVSAAGLQRYDPRIILRSSCLERQPRRLAPGPLFDLGTRLRPQVVCDISADNVYATGGVVARVSHSSPLGMLLTVAFFAVVAGALGWGLVLYRRQRQEVVAFAQQVKIPYIAGPPVSGDMFFGRDRLVSQLLRGVAEGGYYALVADDKRIGKSSLLLRIHELLRQQAAPAGRARVFPIYYSLERSRQGRTFFVELWRFMSELVQQYALADDISVSDPQTESEAFTAVLDLLNALHSHQIDLVVVLLFDEFQILAGDNASPAARDAAQRLRSITAETCRDRLSWVAAGVGSLLNPRPQDLDSDLLLVGPRFSLGMLDEADALRLIREPIASLPIDFEPRAEARILSYSKSHPFVIQYTCRTLLANAALDVAASGRLEHIVISERAVHNFTRDVDLQWLVNGEPSEVEGAGEVAEDPGEPA